MNIHQGKISSPSDNYQKDNTEKPKILETANTALEDLSQNPLAEELDQQFILGYN